MNPKDTRIVFMGTPTFAVASLDALVKAGFSIVSVVTAPDKPAGRGLQLQQSAVKKYAVENNLPVLQPTKLKDPAFIEALKVLDAQLFVVVAFRMLPEVVWDMPPMGTINVHGSLLPSYRGAAPINWAVINGEKETGVTTFKLKAAIDTGNILYFTVSASRNGLRGLGVYAPLATLAAVSAAVPTPLAYTSLPVADGILICWPARRTLQ
jgi:methionyl-tRNA formyltransferase